MRIWSHSNERSQEKSDSLGSQRTNDGESTREDKSSSLGKSQGVADEYFQFTTTVPGWNIQERESLVAGSHRGCVRYAPTNNRKYP